MKRRNLFKLLGILVLVPLFTIPTKQKTKNYLKAGYVYAPYIPLQRTYIINKNRGVKYETQKFI